MTRSVGLAIIAKDEERCIGRALDSARGLVDHAVVVDTGSSDATAAVARAHGAEVAEFTWVDDFSAARNHALSLSPCDVTLMLDADEWLEAAASDPLRRWVEHSVPDEAGLLRIDSDSISDGSLILTTAHIVRFIPRGVTFRGRVHEEAVGYAQARRVHGVTARHDGYLPAQMQRKRGRNATLLRPEVARDPSDPYPQFQLGREAQIDGDHAAAASLYLRALENLATTAPWRDDLVSRLLYTLQADGRTDEALALARTEMTHRPSAEVLFAAGNLFLDTARTRPGQAGKLVAMAEGAWRACLRVGEPTDGRDHTPGCGSYLAAENLAGLCEARGDERGRVEWVRRAHDMRRALSRP